MNSNEDEERLRGAISQMARDIVAIDLVSLYRKEDLGKHLSFDIGAHVFHRIFQLAYSIQRARLELLCHSQLERVHRYLQAVFHQFAVIRDFGNAGANQPAARDRIIDTLDSEYVQLFKDSPLSAVLFIPSLPDANEITTKANEAIAKLDVSATARLSALDEQSKEADDLVRKMREASGTVALASYSTYFQQQADNARTLALAWLGATILSAAALLEYLTWLVFYWKPDPSFSTIQVLQTSGTKIALFTVGFYIVSWCGRNFKAQWHTRIVNAHRASTLKSMEAFANSAKNESTREAVLIHASSAIFAQVSTGFIPDQADAPSNPSILEIVRSGKGD